MIFNETQQRTLHGLLDRLIPPDDYPGAWDAGVGDYIIRQLSGDLAALHAVYVKGLDALDEEAHVLHDRSFYRLDPDEQEDLLRRIEAGIVEREWSEPPERFFSLVVHHAAEGYYADPGNGGNRGARSWEMIGFIIQEGVRRVG